MRGRQAKILSDDNLVDLLLFAETSRHPLRNKVIVLLSAKAGLRAGEIAQEDCSRDVLPGGVRIVPLRPTSRPPGAWGHSGSWRA